MTWTVFINAYIRAYDTETLELLGIVDLGDDIYKEVDCHVSGVGVRIHYRQEVVDWINSLPEDSFYWLSSWEKDTSELDKVGISRRPYLPAPENTDLYTRRRGKWKSQVGYGFAIENDDVIWIGDDFLVSLRAKNGYAEAADGIHWIEYPPSDIMIINPDPIDGLTDIGIDFIGG